VWNERLAKLTDSDRAKIAAFRAEGMTIRALARRFGVSEGTISRLSDEKRTGKPIQKRGWGRSEGWGEV